MFLRREDKFFQQHRWQWIAQGKEGQYVAVHGDQVGAFHPTLRLALLDGCRRWAPHLFLVRRVMGEQSGGPFDWLAAPPLWGADAA